VKKFNEATSLQWQCVIISGILMLVIFIGVLKSATSSPPPGEELGAHTTYVAQGSDEQPTDTPISQTDIQPALQMETEVPTDTPVPVTVVPTQTIEEPTPTNKPTPTKKPKRTPTPIQPTQEQNIPPDSSLSFSPTATPTSAPPVVFQFNQISNPEPTIVIIYKQIEQTTSPDSQGSVFQQPRRWYGTYRPSSTATPIPTTTPDPNFAKRIQEKIEATKQLDAQIESELTRSVYVFFNNKGVLGVKKTHHDGTEYTLIPPEEEVINDKLQEAQVSIGETDETHTLLAKNEYAAQSNDPISYDAVFNRFSVFTSDGIKNITLFPNDAVERAKQKNVIDSVTSIKDGTTDSEGNPLKVISMENSSGSVLYKITGTKVRHLIGIIPITIKKTITVTADTGEITSEQKSFADSIWEYITL
jgi:hypothetical protein